jgi:hypothetical protein
MSLRILYLLTGLEFEYEEELDCRSNRVDIKRKRKSVIWNIVDNYIIVGILRITIVLF